nr:hypothetical protein [Tanacetum cinerariifolium]
MTYGPQKWNITWNVQTILYGKSYKKGNGPVQVSIDTNGQIRVLPPKTAKEILAREKERKARTTLLIPKDHLAKFYKMNDAKEMWEVIKSRFGGNDESKKMLKYLMKQQFESFSVSNSEGLHKGFNRTKPEVDTLNFDDLYNNVKVFESDVKGSTGSSFSTQNVAFVSSENTSSTNEVNTAYGVFTSFGHNSQKEGYSSYIDDLMYSFFANQSSGPQLDHEDLEQTSRKCTKGLLLLVEELVQLVHIDLRDKDLLKSKDPQVVSEPENDTKVHVSLSCKDKSKKHDEKAKRKSPVDLSTGVKDLSDEFEDIYVNSANRVNAASAPVTTVGPNSTNSTTTFNAAGPSDNVFSPNFEIGRKYSFMDHSQYTDDLDMPALEDIIYSDDEEDFGAKADFSNLETSIIVSPIPTTRVHKDHHVTQIIGDLSLAPQTRSMTRMVKEQGGLTQINDEDFHTCTFSCFLSQERHQALKDPSWIEAMQEELIQFKMKKGHTQEEGIDYKEVFALVARIEAIRLFLAYASFMGFMVYQMDVKSDFLYGTIEKEVYAFQPLGFKDPDYPDKFYKVVKALYGLHQAPRAWYETLANYLLENGFQRGKIDQTLFIKKQKGDILLVQFYVDDIIFGSTNKELCKAFEKLMKDKF